MRNSRNVHHSEDFEDLDDSEILKVFERLKDFQMPCKFLLFYRFSVILEIPDVPKNPRYTVDRKDSRNHKYCRNSINSKDTKNSFIILTT